MILKDKVALVTGASRGIGKAIAQELAKGGANVVLNSSSGSKDIENVYDELRAEGYNVSIARGNVAVKEDVDTIISEAIAAFGTLDILINNAGITKDNLLVRMTEKDWDDVLNTNLKGTFLCTQAATKIMIKKKSGRIINISSDVGIVGNSGQTNYAASKAGVIGFTKSIAKEFASRGITCNVVSPGFIGSSMTDILPQSVKDNYLRNIPLGRFGAAQEVASLVRFLVSDLASYITGQVIHVDGGLVM